jgi:hypothetical protein
MVFEPLVLRIAPFGLLVNPRPLTVIGSAIAVNEPDSDSAAPEDTVVPDPAPPSAVLLLIATTPVEIVVFPVYVLAADNVNVPTPVFFVNVPEPEMIPDNV